MPVSNTSNTTGQFQQQPKKGSGFVNLSRILGANTGNRLNQAVGQGVSRAATGVRQGLGQEVGRFQEGAEKANLATQENIQARQQALQNIGAGNTSISDDLAKKFAQFRAGQYAGPRELDSTKLSGLSGKAQETEALGRSLSGSGDKSQALRSFAGRDSGSGYSAGQQKLDALLLGKGPGAAQQLGQARREAQGLQGTIGREQNIAREIGKLRAGQAAQFGQETKQALGLKEGGGFDLAGTGAVPDLYKNLQQQVIDYNKAREEAVKQFGADVTGGKYKFGGESYYGVDPRQFMTEQQLAGLSSAANEQQRAQLAALSQLSGTQLTDLIDPSAAIYDPTKPINFDEAAFKAALEGRKGAYEKTLSEATVPVGYGFTNPQVVQESLNNRISQFENLLATTPANQLNYQGYGDYLRANLQDMYKKRDDIRNQYDYYKNY